MKAKKRFGQNFLNNDTIINKIVSLFNVIENDLIIEIGPGRGALTSKLIKLPSKLLCIEIDEDMHKYLDKYESDKCHINYADILQTNLKKILTGYQYQNLYVVGNLPYYITSPIMEYIIESNINAQEMVFMVQKEVAKRYSASVGTKDYGYMTLFLNFYYDVTYEIDVTKDNFNPIPKVDSAVIKLTKKDKIYDLDIERYFKFLKTAFQFKRKTLKNNLSSYDFSLVKPILEKYSLPDTVRPEEINQDIFIEIFKELIN